MATEMSEGDVVMVALCNRADHYIFILFLSSFFFLLESNNVRTIRTLELASFYRRYTSAPTYLLVRLTSVIISERMSAPTSAQSRRGCVICRSDLTAAADARLASLARLQAFTMPTVHRPESPSCLL